MQRTIRLAVVCLAVLVPAAVQAAPILVTNGGGEVIGIDALDIAGDLYDARFFEGSYNAIFTGTGMTPTFLGNAAAAQEAANDILAFLNAETVVPTDLAWFPGTNSNDADLVVPWRVDPTRHDAYNADWSQPNGPWVLQPQNWSRDFDNDLVAMVKFTPTIPEPSTVALLGLGGGALLVGAMRRRRKRAAK